MARGRHPGAPVAHPLLAKQPRAGQRLGDLLLVRHVATGGMASVWLAEDLAVGREVAVKLLAANLAAEPAAVEQLAREAEAIARIDSPYVPRVFGRGVTTSGLPYIVMEMVWGVDLAAWMHARGPMTGSAVATLADQVAHALTRAHERGIVHRDVKPENIVISGTDEHFHAKLVDFGIAKLFVPANAARPFAHEGVCVGTPDYMSPEQLFCPGEVDARADLWSLAVVLYRALVGRLPFVGETLGETCAAIHHGHFRPVSESRPDLPATVDAWFDKALCRDPERRFTSAELMTRTLRVALTEPNVIVATSELAPLSIEPSSAETRSALTRPSAPPRQRRALATGRGARRLWTSGVVAGLMATAALAVSWPRGSHAAVSMATPALRAPGDYAVLPPLAPVLAPAKPTPHAAPPRASGWRCRAVASPWCARTTPDERHALGAPR